ncbi:MAG: MBL fold metallo-hydrolase [Clostridia bacterium]|nr:MBL fold metallo-hydrolase [Clostridia bacterium]
MKEVVRLNQETWCIQEENVRFFLLTGTEKAVMIDSGMTCKNALEIATQLTDLPVELINTHADPDHVACNSQFGKIWMHPAEYANLYFKKDGAAEMNLNPLWDMDTIDLGGRLLKVIELPGHTPGSIAIYDAKYACLFGGDAIQNGRIFMFGPMRNMRAYIHSLKRLENLNLPVKDVLPSHAGSPLKPCVVSGLIRDAEEILAGKTAYTLENVHNQTVRAYQGQYAVFLCDNTSAEG